jgi:two-component system response regulator MprA
MKERVLIVEDDEASVKVLRRGLAYEGYQVDAALDGETGLTLARDHHPDLVILDLMLPGMDGLEVCQRLRAGGNVPILMLTARDTTQDRVQGLDAGADDYVVKPFRMRELLARIRANLRRKDELPQKSEVLRVDGIVLDERTHSVTVENSPVSLTPIEFDLLAVLMRSPGRVHTRGDLVDSLTDSGFTGLDSTLNVHVRNLRIKLEPDPGNPRYIETVFGIGYRFHKPD